MSLLGQIPNDRIVYSDQKLLEENPRFTGAWARLAALYESSGGPAKAEEAYKRAITTEPTVASGFALSLGRPLPRARLLLARIALARGDFAEAEREAQRAAEDPSRRREAMVVTAQVNVAKGQFAEALQILESLRSDLAGEPLAELESTRGDTLARMKPHG